MTATPYRQTLSPRQRTQIQQGAAAITAQLETMFGDDEGWIETWHGHSSTDPNRPGVIIFDKDPGRRWHWHTSATRPKLVAHLLTWARLYGNVYISTTLYSRPERTRQWALPSRVLFVDDAPEHAPLAYSMAIETSAGNRQAYYLLTEPVDVATRQDMQRRIAYALGADKSGHDIEQLGRVPGTFNTKHGARYPVTLTFADGPRYSLGELAAQFPPVAQTAPAGLGELATADIERWLGNIDQLLGADGLPKRLRNPNGQARRVLAGEIHMPSSSDDRACVCRGLVMHGYPDAEIAALLIHLCDYGATARKGAAWLLGDIGRLIGKERERQPGAMPSPSQLIGTKTPAPLPSVTRPSRARQDRPQRVTDDQYLADCLADMDAGRQVHRTRREQAARYSVRVITIDRIERRLRERGAIERFTSADRRRSWLAVYAPPMMIVPNPEDAADAAEIAPEVPAEVLSGPQRINGSRAYGEKHTAPIAPPDPEPQTAAIDAADLGDRHAWEQELAIELPRRKRIKRPPIDSLPIAEQIAELKRRRRRVHGAKSRARWIGHDSQAHALERAGELLRKDIERLECEQAAALSVSPAPAQNLTLFDAAPAQELAKVDAMAPEVAQGPTQAQDGPGEPATMETPCSTGHPMQSPADAPSAADGVIPSWTPDTLMDAPKTAETLYMAEPVDSPMQTSLAPYALAAVCSPLPECVPVCVATARACGTVRPYVPDGGWSEATIAALPGVARGGIAADDPWIVLQRELAAQAVQA